MNRWFRVIPLRVTVRRTRRLWTLDAGKYCLRRIAEMDGRCPVLISRQASSRFHSRSAFQDGRSPQYGQLGLAEALASSLKGGLRGPSALKMSRTSMLRPRVPYSRP